MQNKLLISSILAVGLLGTNEASSVVHVQNNSSSTATVEITAVHWNSKDKACEQLNSDAYHSSLVTIASKAKGEIDTSGIPHTSKKEGCDFHLTYVSIGVGEPGTHPRDGGSCSVDCDQDPAVCTKFLTGGNVTIMDTKARPGHLTCTAH